MSKYVPGNRGHRNYARDPARDPARDGDLPVPRAIEARNATGMGSGVTAQYDAYD